MDTETIVQISDLSRGGAGVAREDSGQGSGRVIFVPFSAPGDRVRVRLVEEKKRYAQGELIEILEPSPLRQNPPCPAFGKCGGCQWQHLPYSVQWETKSKGVLHALERVQVSIPDLIDKIPAEQIWEYRNRIQLRGEGNQLGFFKAGSRELVPLDQCRIARPEINQSWEETRQQGARMGRPFKVELEVTEQGEVRKTWNARHSASGFRQVHDQQNEKLKEWIREALSQTDVLFDLFGGSGNLSLSLVDRIPEIHCVDVTVPKARSPEIPHHFQFHRASVLSWLLKERLEGSHKDLKLEKSSGTSQKRSAIMDPPREGLGSDFSEIAPALESLGVTELIAVGCDPDSWARDVSRWVRRGWKLKRLMMIDLFPQTHHIESVALLGL